MISSNDSASGVNKKYQKTLETIQQKPTPANVRWSDVESLLIALGASLREGAGSRVRFELNGRDFNCHRPHPGKEAKQYVLRELVGFLRDVGAIK